MKADETSNDLVEQAAVDEVAEDLDMDALEEIAVGRVLRPVNPQQKTKKSSVPINMTPMGHIVRG